MTSIEKLIEVLENNGWTVSKEENEFCIQQFSPAGQDFSVEITAATPDLFIDELQSYYDNYDVSYEASLWLDDTGHGTNGAPYDMKDVYEDMEACETMVSDLLDELNDIDFGEYEG